MAGLDTTWPDALAARSWTRSAAGAETGIRLDQRRAHVEEWLGQTL